jgi:hypothetical protein
MSAYSDLILSEASLLGYWRLGESVGTTATAAFGAINGTYAGAGVTYGEPGLLSGDPSATSVFFSHFTPGDVRFGDNFDFSGTTNFSAEVWVKPALLEDDGFIWFKSDTNDGWWIEHNGIAVARRYDAAGANDGAVGTALASGSIYHVVMTYDGTDIKIYQNGVEKGTVGSTRSVDTTTTALCLGSAIGGSGFHGHFQDAALYSTALGPSAVLEHYETGVPPKQSYYTSRRMRISRRG